MFCGRSDSKISVNPLCLKENICYNVFMMRREQLLQSAAAGKGGAKINWEVYADMLEYRYDTQLLIEGEDLDEDKISSYFNEHFKGDCLLAVGDEELIKIHYHTNEPWKVLEYCASLGEIYDIVVEDMDRQSRGLKG